MYATKYILAFHNELNELYEIYFDFQNYVGQSMPIFGTENCLTIRCTGGDENKMSSLLGSEAQIEIAVGKLSVAGTEYKNSSITLEDLTAQHDNDVRVSVFFNKDYSKTVFQGFVVVEDNFRPYSDPPYVVTLRALDGIGQLKQVDMVDTTGLLYQGRYSIEDWLGNILYKTGLSLNLRVYFPFFTASAGISILNPLQQIYLDAITWQRGEIISTTDPSVDVFQSEADDAYTALEKICRCLRARLFQQDGVWNFVSLYSYISPDGYNYNESTGTLTAGIYHMNTVSTGFAKTYDVSVGFDQIIHPTKDDANIYLKLATKWIKLNYTYDQSVNKICNQNLQQGDHNASYDGTISSTLYDPTITPTTTFNYKGYEPFCFSHLNGGGNFSTGFYAYPYTTSTTPGYIREINDFLGYPLDRYMVLGTPTGSSITYFRSNKLFIDQNDIFKMSFDWRTRDNLHNTTGISYTVAWVYLYGDDGSFWSLDCSADGTVPGNPTKWIASDSNFQHGTVGSTLISTNFITDTNLWNTVSVNQNVTVGALDLAKAPTSGRIEVLFVFNIDPLGGGEAWFKNINIEVIPYLHGSYKQLKGDYNFSSSKNTIKQTVSEDVEISDSPKRYFKGALVLADGSVIPSNWHRYNVNESFRFTQLMERVYYNNVYRINQKIEGSFRGLTYVDNADVSIVKQAGFINSYFFTDHPTPTKKFMLTSFEKDYATGIGRHVFVEVLADQNDDGFKNPADPAEGSYVFNYLFQ